MSFNELFDGAHDDAFFKLIATKIQDQLRGLRQNRPEANARRWGWELIQNAKDVALDGHPVRVAVSLTEGGEPRVVVQHSGRPFRPDHLYYLMVQTSSKERPRDSEAPETTGRYGTGFLTTHLLSPVVEVGGVLEAPATPPAHFSVELDRSGRTLDELIAGVKRALRVRDTFSSLPPAEGVEPDAFNTTFSYTLDERGLEVAQAGIRDLHRSLPLTLAFTPAVGAVTVQGCTYRVASRHDHGDGIETVNVRADVSESAGAPERAQTSIVGKDEWYLVVRGERTAIAARASSPEDRRLLALGREVPRLFCDFPLVGSESLPLPIAVNSPYFYPDDSRSGLFLEDESDEAAQENRRALSETPRLLDRLLAYVSGAEAWRDRYHLADFGLPSTLTKKAEAWYEQTVLAPVRVSLLVSPLVESEEGANRPLRKPLEGKDISPEVWIPCDAKAEVREALWRFAAADPALRERLPREAHLHPWYHRVWSDCGQLEVGALVERVAMRKSLDALAERLEMTEDEAAEWLSEFVAFLAAHGYDRLLNEHKGRRQVAYPGTGRYSWQERKLKAPILPNQHGTFRLRSELFLDDEIDEALKEVAADLGKDYRAFLLDRRIFLEMPEKGRTKTAKDIAHDIEDVVRQMIRSRDRSEETRRAFRALYAWFEQNEGRAQDLFAGLYEDRHLLIPPDEALDLIRQANRVPELERENTELKQQHDALQQAHERLQNEVNELREQVASTSTEADGVASPDSDALQVAKHYAEEWMKIKVALGSLGTAEAAIAAKDLQRLLETNSALFEHVSKNSLEAYLRFRSSLERAKARVRTRLDASPFYDTSGWMEVPDLPTIVEGVCRRGMRAEAWHPPHPITLVIRPSDGGFVVFYDPEEQAVLANPDAELWIEGDGAEPEHLTLGGLALRLGVNRLPLRVPMGNPALLYLS